VDIGKHHHHAVVVDGAGERLYSQRVAISEPDLDGSRKVRAGFGGDVAWRGWR
jgi:hypothetical protein